MTKSTGLRQSKSSHPRNSQPNDLDQSKTLKHEPENTPPPRHKPKKRPKGEKSKNLVELSEDFEHDQAPEKLSEKGEGNGKLTQGPTPENVSEELDDSEDFEYSHTSTDLFVDRDGFKVSETGPTITRHDTNFAEVRRRKGSSDTKLSNSEAIQESVSILANGASEQAEEGSLLSDVAKDGRRLTKRILRLPRALYPIWRWIFIIYIIWLIISYLVVSTFRFAKSTLAPICSIPLIGSRVPLLCSVNFQPNDQTINVSKIATGKAELIVIMERVGPNFDLAQEMYKHGSTVRDLWFRVKMSNLQHKEELLAHLDSLVGQTGEAAQMLYGFTVRLQGSINIVGILDKTAIGALGEVAKQAEDSPRLHNRVLRAFSPLAALDLMNGNPAEAEVKRLLLSISGRLSAKAKELLAEANVLSDDFKEIQKTLDEIKGLAINDGNVLPRMGPLDALWTRLAHPDEYMWLTSHHSLLKDMIQFYKNASSVMLQVTTALHRVKAELESFQKDFDSSTSILKGQSLEFMIEVLKKSNEGLRAGVRQLNHLEEEDWSKRHKIFGIRSTRTVTANIL